MKTLFLLMASLCLCPSLLISQMINVNPQNRTIAITADDFVEAEPEVAVVTIGHQSYGATEAEAFQNNLRVAEQITRALAELGVAKANVRTENVRLRRTDADEKWTVEQKRQRQFEAQQTWKLHVTASDAQKVIDTAVRAGANTVEDVDWDVADHTLLQAAAGQKALEKARKLAQQMAAELGAKAGALMYASNHAPAWFAPGVTLNTTNATLTSKVKAPTPQLTLFPKKVKADATVYAVFALE